MTNFVTRCVFSFISHSIITHPIKSSGQVSTTQSPTPQKPNSSQTLLRVSHLQAIRFRRPTFCRRHIGELPRRRHRLGKRLPPHAPPQPPLKPKAATHSAVAFSSSEIFRCLSVRQDLLLGLLGADLVGFQRANYARHFRQTVSRILAYEALIKVPQVHSAQA